ncbi:MAG: L,D-transpeptidase [Cyanobium sp.]
MGGLVAGLAAALASPAPGFAAPTTAAPTTAALTTAARTTTEDSAPHRQAAALGEVLGVRAPFRSDQTAPDPVAALQRELVLDRRNRHLTVLENGRQLRRFPVAVGRPGWETPVGRFAVIERVADPSWEHPATGETVPPGPANPLGSRWIGFHRDCLGRSGFNGREHLVVEGCVSSGFHGTPNRDSVGQAVSHGCVRLFDEHVQELFELVRLGTPVTVLP